VAPTDALSLRGAHGARTPPVALPTAVGPSGERDTDTDATDAIDATDATATDDDTPDARLRATSVAVVDADRTDRTNLSVCIITFK
jgi:hypothetical protein